MHARAHLGGQRLPARRTPGSTAAPSGSSATAVDVGPGEHEMGVRSSARLARRTREHAARVLERGPSARPAPPAARPVGGAVAPGRPRRASTLARRAVAPGEHGRRAASPSPPQARMRQDRRRPSASSSSWFFGENGSIDGRMITRLAPGRARPRRSRAGEHAGVGGARRSGAGSRQASRASSFGSSSADVAAPDDRAPAPAARRPGPRSAGRAGRRCRPGATSATGGSALARAPLS